MRFKVIVITSAKNRPSEESNLVAREIIDLGCSKENDDD